jgi:lipopolysaccharide export system permease protein
MNEQMVPAAARESNAMMMDLAQTGGKRSGQPISQVYVQEGKVVAMYGAKDFNLLDKTMRDVYVLVYGKAEEVVKDPKTGAVVIDPKTGQPAKAEVERPLYLMTVGALEATPGNLTDWRITQGGDVIRLPDGDIHLKITSAWPEQIPKVFGSPEDLFAAQTTDPAVWSMRDIRKRVTKGRETGSLTDSQIRNLEYQYWNKIALPLAAFIFGTLGATLGIRNHRTGAATGFAVSIAIIFSYFTLANFMSVYASGGIFPPYIASFTPLAIGLVASGVIIWRRNR